MEWYRCDLCAVFVCFICDVCNMFVMVCSIWVVGWSESAVCVGCEVSCGVNGTYLVCVYVL